MTLLGHKDADFFAFGAETQLPLVGITVPVKAFFYAAPVLIGGLYVYLNLYMMNLWDALAEAPATVDGSPLADRVYPWLISYAALWYRDRRRKDGSSAPRALGRVIIAVSLALGSLFAIVMLGLLWWRSMPAHDEWLPLWIGLNFWFAFLVGQTGFLAARARMAGASRGDVARAHQGRRIMGAVLAVVLATVSWETTESGRILPLYPADLREADITRKPAGTVRYEFWVNEYQPKYRKREDIDKGTDLTADRAFIVETVARFNAPLDAPDLQGADLRNADMTRAFLPGADLRGAHIQGTDLSEAEMQGTVLRFAEVQGANLNGAEMQGADLWQAKMLGADLSKAEMRGAVLSEAEMQDADCSSVALRGALLQSTTLTCQRDTLTQEQLEQTVDDSETVLPVGLKVASCLEALPGDVEAALAHHPEEGGSSARPAQMSATPCSATATRRAT